MINVTAKITSNAAEMLLADRLKRTEQSLRFKNTDIEKCMSELARMWVEKAELEVHVESLKEALAKCLKP